VSEGGRALRGAADLAADGRRVTVSPFQPILVSPEVIESLRALHPSSDVEQLFRLSEKTLRLTLLVARDIYNQGHALDPQQGQHAARVELVREVLELRARFSALTPERRRALQVGHASTTLDKQVLVSFR